MGGRGSASGMPTGVSSEQRRLMNNLIRRNSNPKNSKQEYSEPRFTKNKDGSVTYEYQKKRLVTKVHGGKMQSEEKNDIYERTETYSGKIMRDGLHRKNKSVYTDVLVKRGKR